MKSQHLSAINNREKFRPKTYPHNFWGELYQHLVEHSKENLLPFYNQLKVERDANLMTDSEFAEMIVTFVQDIPYAYILGDASCNDYEVTLGGCVENIKYGILSPAEFLYSLQGDCDTRTVLLYSALSHFGYDVRIAVSDEYAHSMLLLNLPNYGPYIED